MLAIQTLTGPALFLKVNDEQPFDEAVSNLQQALMHSLIKIHHDA